MGSHFTERCPSGLRSTLGKRVLGKLNRGFKSHPLRHPVLGFLSPYCFILKRSIFPPKMRECLAIRVARRLGSYGVIDTLADVMLWRGIPEHIRSDNGPEFVAMDLRKWLANVGTGTLYIELGSPWENGYCESFNGKSRNECLNGEISYSLKEAQIVIER
jgi:hypothetical protein